MNLRELNSSKLCNVQTRSSDRVSLSTFDGSVRYHPNFPRTRQRCLKQIYRGSWTRFPPIFVDFFFINIISKLVLTISKTLHHKYKFDIPTICPRSTMVDPPQSSTFSVHLMIVLHHPFRPNFLHPEQF
jgi:hypothetical protein